MKPHVNYDTLAPTYNQRFDKEKPSGVARALQQLAAELKAQHILEVGCGTGRWLADFPSGGVRSGLFGLDFSMGMLAQAKQRQAPLKLVQGRAESLPYPAGSFDLVYCANALHHFDDGPRFMKEASRLLRPGGIMSVTGVDPHGQRDTWYVYQYFDGTYETDLQRFPTWDTVFEWMSSAGLEPLSLRQVEKYENTYPGEEVLKDHFIQKHSCSQLALLSDEAYAAGLDRIHYEVEAAQRRGEVYQFHSIVTLDMATGRKPDRK